MASQGPNSPGTMANSIAYGTTAWTTVDNAKVSDNARASATLTSGTSPTNYLKATNFGFTIPSGATINGVVVEVERRRNGTGNVEDDRVRLNRADDTVGSTDKAVAGDYTTTEAYVTYGSSSDLWGETLTPADVNDADFGLVFASRHVSGVGPAAQVDHIRITIHYTEASGPTPGLIDQSGVVFAPQANLRLSIGLIDQSGVVFSPSMRLNVGMGLIDQSGQVFAPQLNLRISFPLIDQSGAVFAPTVGASGSTVVVGLIDQSGVVFSPQMNLRLSVGLIDQSGVVFSPQTNLRVSMGLISQVGQVFAPSMRLSVIMGLIDQSGVVFDIEVQGGMQLAQVGARAFIIMSRW